MNYRYNDPNKQWLTTMITFPKVLKDRYDYLSTEYKRAFQNPKLRAKLESLDLTQSDGQLKKEVRLILDYTKSWPVNNSAWWGKYVMGAAILRTLKSLDEARRSYTIVKTHEKISKDLWDELHEAGLYPSKNQVESYLKGRPPRLPEDPTFVLDFTDSGPQIFEMTPEGHCRANIGSKKAPTWVEWAIDIPVDYLRDGWTGRIAKPRYRVTRDGVYKGDLPYEVDCPPIPEDTSDTTVMAYDLGTGSVRHYTGVAVHTDGSYGLARVNSKLLSRIHKNIQARRDVLFNQFGEGPLTKDKTSYSRPWGDLTTYERLEVIRQKRVLTPEEALAQARREDYRGRLLAKQSRCMDQEWHQESAEMVQLAVEEGAGEIHLEYLRWLGSKGGHWAFRQVQSKVVYKARLAGILVIEVNPAHSSDSHPVTGEQGKAMSREVVFPDGSRYDRDDLAGLNLGLRKGNRTGRHKSKKRPARVQSRRVKRVPLRKSTVTPKKVRPHSRAWRLREKLRAKALMERARTDSFNNLEVQEDTVSCTGGVNVSAPPLAGDASGMPRIVDTNGPSDH